MPDKNNSFQQVAISDKDILEDNKQKLMSLFNELSQIKDSGVKIRYQPQVFHNDIWMNWDMPVMDNYHEAIEEAKRSRISGSYNISKNCRVITLYTLEDTEWTLYNNLCDYCD